MSGAGGDVTFKPGRGNAGGPDGSFMFYLADGTEALRIDPDGTFSVMGAPVKDGPTTVRDRLVYTAFKSWLAGAHADLGHNAAARFVQRLGGDEPGRG